MKPYDKSFLQRLQQRDDAAFTTLYNDTVDTFFRYLKTTYFLQREEIDDIISSFYVKLRENLTRLDIKASLSWWMWTIFRNLVKDYFKAHSSLGFSELSKKWYTEEWESYEDTISSQEDIVDMFSLNRQYEKITAAIDALEGDYKEVIYLKYVEEKTYEEISIILSMSEQTVRQKVSRWLKKLKNSLSS